MKKYKLIQYGGDLLQDINNIAIPDSNIDSFINNKNDTESKLNNSINELSTSSDEYSNMIDTNTEKILDSLKGGSVEDTIGLINNITTTNSDKIDTLISLIQKMNSDFEESIRLCNVKDLNIIIEDIKLFFNSIGDKLKNYNNEYTALIKNLYTDINNKKIYNILETDNINPSDLKIKKSVEKLKSIFHNYINNINNTINTYFLKSDLYKPMFTLIEVSVPENKDNQSFNTEKIKLYNLFNKLKKYPDDKFLDSNIVIKDIIKHLNNNLNNDYFKIIQDIIKQISVLNDIIQSSIR